MDNVGYKSCIVPKCENNTEIAPNLSFFEVPKTHNYIVDKWREAIGISMDLNTVMYCCQDHFDLKDDTYNYVEYYMSGDANGENKIQLQLKHDAVPHRFECQYHMGHRIKPVSTDCNAIEGSSSDIDPSTCSIPTTPPLEEKNLNYVNILNNSTKDSDLEEVLELKQETNEVKEPEVLTANASEDSSSDIDPLTCSIPTTSPLEKINHSDVNISNHSTKDLDVEEVLEPKTDTNEGKDPEILTTNDSDLEEVFEKIKYTNEGKDLEILTTNAIENSSSDIEPLTCSIPTTSPLEEINHSDVNISNNSTKDPDVEVLEPKNDTNERKHPEILTTNDSDIEEVFEPIKYTKEGKDPEILTTNAIEGSSSDIEPLTCSIPTTSPLEEINRSDVNISNHSTKDLDVEEVLEPKTDTNEGKDPEILTTNAIENSSSDIEPLTCSIPTTSPLEEINHSDVNISNNSTKDPDVEVLEPKNDTNERKHPEILTTNDSDIEEVFEPIKYTKEGKDPEILTTNAIEGSCSDIEPLTFSIPTTSPLEEINRSDVNISNNSTKDPDVEEVLEPKKDTNEGKDPEILTTSDSDIEEVFEPIKYTNEGKDSEILTTNNLDVEEVLESIKESNDVKGPEILSTNDSDVEEVFKHIKYTNEEKDPKILITNAIEGSNSDIEIFTCSIPTTSPLEENNHSNVNILNNSTKYSDVEEVLEPQKDTNEVRDPELLTTNDSDIEEVCEPIKYTNKGKDPEIFTTNNSDVEEVLESIKETNDGKGPEILTSNDSDIEEVFEPIKDTNEVKDPEILIIKVSGIEETFEPIKYTNEVKDSKILTTNAIEGSSCNIDPLTCSIPTTPNLEEINHSEVNISNNSTKDSDVEVLELKKYTNEGKELEILTTNDSVIEEVSEPLIYTNEVKEPEILTTNAFESSRSNIDPLTCSISSKPHLQNISVNILNNFTIDVEEILEPLTTNANSNITLIDNKIVNKSRLLNIYKNKRLKALCKPLKIPLEDLKNIIVPKIDDLVQTDVLTGRVINKTDPEYLMVFKRKQDEIHEIVLKKRRKLISRIITWEREQNHCIAIHDLQCKEIDIYYLNSDLDITTYKRIIDVSRLSENEQYPFNAEFKGRDDRLSVNKCCCWFNRENVLKESLAKYVRKSIEFTKKIHPCKGGICTCCCRNYSIINSYSKFLKSTLLNVYKTVSIWLKHINANHKSAHLKQALPSSAVLKAMIVTPKVHIDNIVRISDASASLNIKINNDYYQIVNGHIVLYTNYEDCSGISNIPLAVNKNVCCWYVRENLLNYLLKQKVSLSAVKFMKTPHLCPITECKCCCKPKQSKKTLLHHIYVITRHTTDTNWNYMKIKIGFSNAVRPLSKTIPVTQTKISRDKKSKDRILDNKIWQNKASVSDVHVSSTRTLQKKFPLSNPIILQNNKSYKPERPVIYQSNTNETGVFDLNSVISQTIEERFSVSQNSFELDPADTRESTSNNSIPEPMSPQPFVIHMLKEPTSFLGASMAAQNDPPNSDVEMENTPNNNLIITSVVSLAGVEASNATVVPNNVLNTVTDVAVVPDNSGITNSLSPTYINPKLKRIYRDRCRAKNPSNCKCKSKSSIIPTESVSDLNKKPIHLAQITPTVGSIISMADLSDVSIPVLSDEIQDSNEPSICTFIPIPNTDSSSVVTNNFTAEASCVPIALPAPSLKKSSESGASTSHMPETAAPKHFNKIRKLLTKPNETLRSSTIDILKKISRVRFIYKPGHKLSAQLGTALRNLSTTELQILNSAFVMLEHQINAAGLEKEIISFTLNNIFDNIVLPEPENKASKVKSIVSNSNFRAFESKPAEMYTRLGSLASLKQIRDTKSFNALVKKVQKEPENKSKGAGKTTKRSVKFSLDTNKIHTYDAGSSSFKKVRRQ